MQTIAIVVLILFIAATTLTAAPAAIQRPLADAEYHMKDVDKNVPVLTEQATKAAKMTPNELHKALNLVNGTGLKLNNVLSRLQQLPANEPAVAALQKRAATRASELLAAENAFKQAVADRTKAVEAAMATLEPDTKQLEALSRQLANERMLQSHPSESIPVVESLTEMVKLRDALAQKYAAILNQHEGRQLAGVIGGFDNRLQTYQHAMKQNATELPARIRADLEQACSIADLAKQRKNARPFTAGGIQQAFGRAKTNLTLLVAIDGKNSTSTAIEGEIAAAEKNIASAQTALESQILDANTAPNDLYRESDRDAILAAVRKAWAAKHAKQEVLDMRIPMHAWDRQVSWRWALDRFLREDISQLQVAILTKASNEVCHVYYAKLDRDHMAGDKQRIRIDDSGEVPLYRKILMSKLSN